MLTVLVGGKVSLDTAARTLDFVCEHELDKRKNLGNLFSHMVDTFLFPFTNSVTNMNLSHG